MLDYLKGKEDFLGQLLHHIGTSAIMDLLLRLITCIEAQDTRSQCITVSITWTILYTESDFLHEMMIYSPA